MKQKPKKIALLPGDGIGPEVTAEAVKVLRSVEKQYSVRFDITEVPIGAFAIRSTGEALPEKTLELCRSSDAVLLGAIGSPEFDQDPSAKVRPEQGLLRLRRELGLFANIRPVETYSCIAHLSPLKQQFVRDVDLVFFRELTGGIYFGAKETRDEGKSASDICEYTEFEILRIAKLAFEAAAKRRQKLTLVDKANVLETSRLWRRVVQGLSLHYPQVRLECMYVDSASMKLMQDPRSFDVILTENMFGDILTDEASVIPGSLGLLPSASVGTGISLFEPVHGSYPEAAGKGIANPVGSILSAAMMLESLGMNTPARRIRKAVKESLFTGVVTKDVDPRNGYSTSEVGDTIASMVMNEVPELV